MCVCGLCKQEQDKMCFSSYAYVRLLFYLYKHTVDSIA